MIVALFAILALVIGHAQAQDSALFGKPQPSGPTLSYKCCKSVTVTEYSDKLGDKYVCNDPKELTADFSTGKDGRDEKPFGGACCVPVVIATYGSSRSVKGDKNPEPQSDIIAVLNCNGDVWRENCRTCEQSKTKDIIGTDNNRKCGTKSYTVSCECKNCQQWAHSNKHVFEKWKSERARWLLDISSHWVGWKHFGFSVVSKHNWTVLVQWLNNCIFVNNTCIVVVINESHFWKQVLSFCCFSFVLFTQLFELLFWRWHFTVVQADDKCWWPVAAQRTSNVIVWNRKHLQKKNQFRIDKKTILHPFGFTSPKSASSSEQTPPP